LCQKIPGEEKTQKLAQNPLYESGTVDGCQW